MMMSFTGYSQECTLTFSGHVRDQHHQENLEYATVYIQESGTGAVVDSNGYFILKHICPGKYHIIISHIGCESKSMYLTLAENMEVTLYLEHHEELMDEIEITGQEDHSKVGLNKNLITKELLFDQSGKSLSEILTSVSGISMLKSGPNLGKPVIQGMSGNRITILNNGIPQEGQQWGNDHSPEIDPMSSDKISVYKGAASIRFGLQAMGGIVVLEPTEIADDPHWHGSVQLNAQTNGRMYGSHGLIRKSYPFGKLRITGGYNRSGDKHTPDYYLTNTGNKDISGSVLLSNHKQGKWARSIYYSYFYNKNGILRGSHVGNLTDLQEAFTREIPFYTKTSFSSEIGVPRQEVQHHLLKYSTKYFINETNYYSLDIGIQMNKRAEFDIRRSNRSETPALSLTLISQYYDLFYAGKTKTFDYTAGMQYRNSNNTNNPETGILPLIPDYIQNTAALYFITKSNFSGIQLETGFRGEFRHYFVARITNARQVVKEDKNFLNWAANAGFKKQFNRRLKTGLDFSITNRPPEVNELYSNGLHQGVSGIEEGNPTLVSEKSFKIVNEWEGEITRSTHFSSSIFFNRINNYIYLQPQSEFRLTIRGAFPVFRYVGTDALLTGGDIKLIQNISDGLQATGSISYIYGRNVTSQHGLIRIPPLQLQFHIENTFGKWGKIQEIKTSLGVSYEAQQNNVNTNEDFLATPKSYYIIQSGIKCRLKTNAGNDVDVLFRAENLLNSSYRQYLNRLRYFADETGRNLSIHIKTFF